MTLCISIHILYCFFFQVYTYSILLLLLVILLFVFMDDYWISLCMYVCFNTMCYIVNDTHVSSYLCIFLWTILYCVSMMNDNAMNSMLHWSHMYVLVTTIMLMMIIDIWWWVTLFVYLFFYFFEKYHICLYSILCHFFDIVRH